MRVRFIQRGHWNARLGRTARWHSDRRDPCDDGPALLGCPGDARLPAARAADLPCARGTPWRPGHASARTACADAEGRAGGCRAEVKPRGASALVRSASTRTDHRLPNAKQPRRQTIQDRPAACADAVARSTLPGGRCLRARMAPPGVLGAGLADKAFRAALAGHSVTVRSTAV